MFKLKIFLRGLGSIMFEDKVLVCKDCGAEFTFTAGEQEFYAEKGFRNKPPAARPAGRLARTLPAASA